MLLTSEKVKGISYLINKIVPRAGPSAKVPPEKVKGRDLPDLGSSETRV